MRDRVPDDRVAGDRLGHDHAAPRARALDQRFRPAVLVAELDLERQHLLAVTLETEMPRLDDAGVHGADGDLVDTAAGDREEAMSAIRITFEVAVTAQRLQPRMTLRNDSALLEDLALEGLGAGPRCA